MKVGDMVRHSSGAITGHGLVLARRDSLGSESPYGRRANIMWVSNGHVTFQNLAVAPLEVINESR